MKYLFAALMISLFSVGCVSSRLAGQGPAVRAPFEVEVDYANGDFAGGRYKSDGTSTSSVVHVEKEEFYEGGEQKSRFMLSSDPTLVQLAHSQSVQNVMAQELQNFSGAVSTFSSALSSTLPLLNAQYAQYRATQAQYAPPPSADPGLRDEIRSLGSTIVSGIAAELEKRLPANGGNSVTTEFND
jgi:hypothetical protein